MFPQSLFLFLLLPHIFYFSLEACCKDFHRIFCSDMNQRNYVCLPTSICNFNAVGIQKLKQKILCYTKFGIYAHIHHSLFKGSFRFLFGRSDVCPNIESSPLKRSSFLRFNLLQIIVINAIHDTLYKRVNFLVSVIVFCFCF